MIEREGIALIRVNGTAAYRRGIDALGKQTTLELLSARTMLQRLHPDLFKRYSWEAFDLDAGNSSDMTMEQRSELAIMIQDRVMPNFMGAVLIHGTNTAPHTAATLAYAFREGLRIPIVIVFGQRHHEREGSDSQHNIESAARMVGAMAKIGVTEVCVYSGLRGLEAYRGVEVEKLSDNDLRVFTGLEPLARLTGHQIEILKEARKYNPNTVSEFRPHFLQEGIQIMEVGPGFDPEIINHLSARGHRALVLNSYETGNVPEDLLKPIEQATERGMAIVIKTAHREHSLAGVMPIEELTAVGSGALTVAGTMTNPALWVKLSFLLAERNHDLLQSLGGLQRALDTNLVGELPENRYTLVG